MPSRSGGTGYVVQEKDIQMKRTNKTSGDSKANNGEQFVYRLLAAYSLPTADRLLLPY